MVNHLLGQRLARTAGMNPALSRSALAATCSIGSAVNTLGFNDR